MRKHLKKTLMYLSHEYGYSKKTCIYTFERFSQTKPKNNS